MLGRYPLQTPRPGRADDMTSCVVRIDVPVRIKSMRQLSIRHCGLVIMTLGLVCACGGARRHRGQTLSSAMSGASGSGSSQVSRPVASGSSAVSSSLHIAAILAPYPEALTLSPQFQISHLGGDAISHMYQFGITASFDFDDYHRLGTFLNFGSVHMEPGSLADAASVKARTIGCGLRYDGYLLPPQAALRPYLGCGFSYNHLYWNLAHPLSDGLDEIRWDSIDYMRFFATLGISLVPTSQIFLQAEANADAYLFGVTTGQGFHNDVFNNTSGFSYTFAIGFRF